MHACLLSHERAVRRGALRLLAPGLLLQAEECAPDVRGARERVVLIGKIARVGGAEGQGVEVGMAVRWLVGEFLFLLGFVISG